MHAKNTWEPIEGIAHLRQLFKKYQAKNPDKPIPTSLPVDKGTLPPPIAARSRAKVAFSNIYIGKDSPMRLHLSE